MAASKHILYCFLMLSFLLAAPVSAQQQAPALERTISVSFVNEPLVYALDEIAKQGHFSFSYNPDAIDLKRRINLKMKNKTVREVLDQLTATGLAYKLKGRHVILTAAKDKESAVPPYFIISGYVTHGGSGEKVPEVSIYDKSSRTSSVTNRYGFFELKVDRKTNALQLVVNKQQFRDTLIYVRQTGNAIINVTIYPETGTGTAVDSAAMLQKQLQEDQLAFINFMLSEEQKANTKNVKDTLSKKFQFAFLPFVGSNLRLSGNTVNDYSLNLLAGYSMGTRKAEIAGLANIDRDSVQHMQLAGLINAVGGPVQGVQAAGLLNANMQTTKGVQLAGLLNSNLGPIRGVQAAGLLNSNLDSVRGFQAAGLLNSNLDIVNGVQVAGLLNANMDDIRGISIAGLLNSTLGKTEGGQFAGLLNISRREVNGVRVAGLLNVCLRDLGGTQVSGMINYAGKVAGSQLGLLNVSDTSTGIPVGFLSFVYRGYHTIEISADEVFPVNLSLRTGVRKFYNIFTSGMKTADFGVMLWHFGYGIGSSIHLGKKWWMNFDLTTQQLVKGSSFEQMNLLSKFNLTADRYISRKMAVVCGPVFNFYTSNTTVPYYKSDFDKLPPYTFFNESYSNNLNIKMWIGGKIALRFL